MEIPVDLARPRNAVQDRILITYLVRRTLVSVLIVVIASVIIFTLVDAVSLSAFGVPLDSRMILSDYVGWAGNLLHGDLGTSQQQHASVASIIARNAWPTILLMGSSLALTVVLAIPFGACSAIRRHGFLDRAGRAFFFVGYSLPGFWLGAILQLVLGVYLVSWAGALALPISGIHTPGNDSLTDLLRHLALPVITLSLASLAQFARFQRGAMMEALSADYVRTARAKGLRDRSINYKHALRNALLPTVTLLALSMGAISGGAVVIETVFSWPGLGFLLVDSLFKGDFLVLVALLMINAVFIVFFNLVADLAYVLLDPRVSYDE